MGLCHSGSLVLSNTMGHPKPIKKCLKLLGIKFIRAVVDTHFFFDSTLDIITLDSNKFNLIVFDVPDASTPLLEQSPANYSYLLIHYLLFIFSF